MLFLQDTVIYSYLLSLYSHRYNPPCRASILLHQPQKMLLQDISCSFLRQKMNNYPPHRGYMILYPLASMFLMDI
jgi:hypothetical protein